MSLREAIEFEDEWDDVLKVSTPELLEAVAHRLRLQGYLIDLNIVPPVPAPPPLEEPKP